jgi:hypothetical protein
MHRSHDPLGASQAYRCAISRPHHESGPAACRDGSVGFLPSACPRSFDYDHAIAVLLAEPCPWGVGQ